MSLHVGYQILRYSDGLSDCWRRRYTSICFEFLVKLQINCNESKYLFKSIFGKEEMDSAEGSGRQGGDSPTMVYMDCWYFQICFMSRPGQTFWCLKRLIFSFFKLISILSLSLLLCLTTNTLTFLFLFFPNSFFLNDKKLITYTSNFQTVKSVIMDVHFLG